MYNNMMLSLKEFLFSSRTQKAALQVIAFLSLIYLLIFVILFVFPMISEAFSQNGYSYGICSSLLGITWGILMFLFMTPMFLFFIFSVLLFSGLKAIYQFRSLKQMILTIFFSLSYSFVLLVLLFFGISYLNGLLELLGCVMK
jgi:hypothetical protein